MSGEIAMKSIFFSKICGTTALTVLAIVGTANAEENPLLQPNELSAESSFEAKARAIDLAATKDSNDPVCQNIRANYDEELTKIVRKTKSPDDIELSQINRYSYGGSGLGTITRLNRINRNLGGSYNRGLGGSANEIVRGAEIANDAVAVGKMLGIGGKMSHKKAKKKTAKLDAQALDAIKQTGCPMSTFN